jgi:predicted ArsR family transcriptional regulator
MAGHRAGTLADRVRQFAAAAGGQFRRAECAEKLGITPDGVKKGITQLVAAKELRRVGHGVYVYEEQKARPLPEVEERIWHAMRINPKWSVGDIALQAGTTVNYVYIRLREYRAEGLVDKVGRRKTSPTSSEKLWRLTAKAQRDLEPPKVEPFRPDPLAEAAIRLARLVCNGLAGRYPDHAEEAAGLCERIKAGLEEIHHGEAGDTGN